MQAAFRLFLLFAAIFPAAMAMISGRTYLWRIALAGALLLTLFLVFGASGGRRKLRSYLEDFPPDSLPKVFGQGGIQPSLPGVSPEIARLLEGWQAWHAVDDVKNFKAAGLVLLLLPLAFLLVLFAPPEHVPHRLVLTLGFLSVPLALSVCLFKLLALRLKVFRRYELPLCFFRDPFRERIEFLRKAVLAERPAFELSEFCKHWPDARSAALALGVRRECVEVVELEPDRMVYPGDSFSLLCWTELADGDDEDFAMNVENRLGIKFEDSEWQEVFNGKTSFGELVEKLKSEIDAKTLKSGAGVEGS